MKYVAKEAFVDRMDDNHMYRAGDEYPRPGYNASGERVAELAGTDNKVGRPLIAATEQPEKPAPETFTKPMEDTDTSANPSKKPRRSCAKGDVDD